MTANIKDDYKARREAEEQGVPCVLFNGAEVTLKSVARNKEFARLMKGVIAGQRISDEKLFDQLAKALAETVVIGWEGFEDDYSPEAFIETCTDLRDCGFLEDVLSFASDTEVFGSYALAVSAKN